VAEEEDLGSIFKISFGSNLRTKFKKINVFNVVHFGF
jgi:hypothetical protein